MYEQISTVLTTSFQVPPADLRPDATLGDLGLDSLELAELGEILADLGARVQDEELVEQLRLDELAQLVERRIAESAAPAPVPAEP